MESRSKVVKKLQDLTGLSEIEAKDMEVGIFNWTIQYADEHNTVKLWKNPRFYHLYFNKVRSILANLDRDGYIENPRLLTRVQEKEFLPHEIASMAPQNLYPEKWREVEEEYLRKFEHAFENRAVAMTDMYRCSKCKKKECSYYELQTRSSDEAITVFVRCILCGNHWKM